MGLVLLLGHQLRAYAEAGYEVFGASAVGEYADELAAMDIPHIRLKHVTRSRAPLEDGRALGELHRVFVGLRPDVVHTHNPKPGVYGRLAARAASVPSIVNTVHGLYAAPDDGVGRKAAVYALEALAARCSHAELIQNEEDLDVLTRLRVPAERLHLLGNGIDLRRFDPTSVEPSAVAERRREMGAGPNDVVVGVVSRLVWEKGYREVFAAADLVRRHDTRAKVVVIGPDDPSKADALTRADIAAAERLGVRFLGRRDDVVELYAAMDLYVLASYREGYPRSAMEAAAMGLPVVATDIRGCRQVVEDGVTGMLVPVRDAGALAAAIGRLAGDAELRRRVGEAARRRAETEFNETRVIAITLAVYRQLLERAGGPLPVPDGVR